MPKFSKFVSTLFACLCLLWLGSAQGQVQISNEAYWQSTDASPSFATLEKTPFKAFDKILSLGYGADYVWIRIRVVPDSNVYNETGKWVIRIRPSYLDEVALFDTAQPTDPMTGLPSPEYTGDTQDFSKSRYRSFNHGFVINASRTPRDIYLRLKSTSTRLINVEVMTEEQAEQADRQQEFIYAIYLALLLFFTAWALLHWYVTKERLLGVFFIKQVVMVAHALAILGYLKVLLSSYADASILDKGTSYLVLLLVGITLLFELIFLKEFKPIKWLWNLTFLLFIPWVIGLLLMFLGVTSLALNINIAVGLSASALFFLLALTARAWSHDNHDDPPLVGRKLLIGFYLAFAITAYTALLPMLGFVKSPEWALNSQIYIGFVSGTLIVLLLMIRARNQEKIRAETMLNLKLVEQQAAVERERREEQEQFLAMLTHELKTPISVAQMTLGAMKADGPMPARIERALKNIDQVVERCRISGELESHHLQVEKEYFDPVELVSHCIDMLPHQNRVKACEGYSDFIYSDSQLVGIITTNLLDNALKYSLPDTEIQIELRELAQNRQSGVEICVRNQVGAAGFPDSERVFHKYYRAKAAQGKSGSGLGLYLSAGIAELLGASLTCHATGNQVEFRFWLPS